MGKPAEFKLGKNGQELPGRQRGESSLRSIWRYLRRLIVVVLGIVVVMVGVVMIVTPGPAIVVIPVGLAMLGVRFDWLRRRARRLQRRLGGFVPRIGLRRLGRSTAPEIRTACPNQAAPLEEVDSRSS